MLCGLAGPLTCRRVLKPSWRKRVAQSQPSQGRSTISARNYSVGGPRRAHDAGIHESVLVVLGLARDTLHNNSASGSEY